MKDVIVLYKNLGETPRECLERFKKTLAETGATEAQEYATRPMTYAGRLDPMAEGLLLVLSGEAIVKKETYTSLPKTYEFEILWGARTDTSDILGLVETEQPVKALEKSLYHLSQTVFETAPAFPDIDVLKKKSEKLAGEFEQKYPAYSSRTVPGLDEHGKRVTRSLIEWARLGKISEIEIPSHIVEIFSTEHVSRRFVAGAELLVDIEKRVALVRGDFRQEKIVGGWRVLLSSQPEKQFALDTMRVDVSGGFYIRQFVEDLARAFHTTATTYHITRTRIGDFNNPTDFTNLH